MSISLGVDEDVRSKLGDERLRDDEVEQSAGVFVHFKTLGDKVGQIALER